MKSSKYITNAAVIASLLTSFLIACAPPNNKSKFQRGTVSGKPLTQAQGDLVGKKYLPTYDPATEANKAINNRFLGATILVNGVTRDDKGKFTAELNVKIVLVDELEAIKAKGLAKEALNGLELEKNKCGKEIEDYSVEAMCVGENCNGLVVQLTEKKESGAAGVMPLIFRKKSDNVYTLDYSYAVEGGTENPRINTAETALETRDAKLREAHGEEFAKTLKSCDAPETPAPVAPAAPTAAAPETTVAAPAVTKTLPTLEAAASGTPEGGAAPEAGEAAPPVVATAPAVPTAPAGPTPEEIQAETARATAAEQARVREAARAATTATEQARAREATRAATAAEQARVREATRAATTATEQARAREAARVAAAAAAAAKTSGGKTTVTPTTIPGARPAPPVTVPLSASGRV